MNQKILKQDDYYHTSDLALAATISLFYPLESVNRQNPNKVEFVFRRDAGLDHLIETFWRQELKVEPQAFFFQLKVIKARIYQNKHLRPEKG